MCKNMVDLTELFSARPRYLKTLVVLCTPDHVIVEIDEMAHLESITVELSVTNEFPD